MSDNQEWTLLTEALVGKEQYKEIMARVPVLVIECPGTSQKDREMALKGRSIKWTLSYLACLERVYVVFIRPTQAYLVSNLGHHPHYHQKQEEIPRMKDLVARANKARDVKLDFIAIDQNFYEDEYIRV